MSSTDDTKTPVLDVKTGQLINPHNPEFLTKRPWYLQEDVVVGGGGAGAGDFGPSLDHQRKAGSTAPVLTLTAAEEALQKERTRQEELLKAKQQTLKFSTGQWVEALKKNKAPYRICQIVKVAKKSATITTYDLQYEDGTVERNVKVNSSSKDTKPRIRMTKTGSRASANTATAAAAGTTTDVQESYDSKRDQYHGYDRDAHNAQLNAKYEQREALRRQLRQQEKKQNQKEMAKQQQEKQENGEERENNNNNKKEDADSDSDAESDIEDSDDSDNDEFVQKDSQAKVISTRLARQGGVGGAQMQMTARNLRIREDTAKYLRNLDPNSAYYDPKSRSMRDNPNPSAGPDESDFTGDNAARITGDAVTFASTQLFCWEAEKKLRPKHQQEDEEQEQDSSNLLLHPQANPSQAEILRKQFQKKSVDLKLQSKKAVLDKYGGQEYLDGTGGLAAAAAATAQWASNGGGQRSRSAGKQSGDGGKLDRTVRFGVSTTLEEYDPAVGSVKRGGVFAAAAAAAKKSNANLKRESKYEEDVFINGHTTVWGSYFQKGAFTWGYADDHSLMKNSYCTGETGRMANDEANEMKYGTGKAGSAALAQARGMLKASSTIAVGGCASGSSAAAAAAAVIRNRSKHYGEVDPNAVELDPNKLKDAVERAKKQQQQQADDKSKRKYHSMNAEVNMTDEDMEAYRMLKDRGSDPMAKFDGGNDELLDYDPSTSKKKRK